MRSCKKVKLIWLQSKVNTMNNQNFTKAKSGAYNYLLIQIKKMTMKVYKKIPQLRV